VRIGLYGGSFNPVHAGHVGIARRAIAELTLDRLLVIPAAVSPFKVGASGLGAVGFSPEARLALVRAAFADVPCATVDERELRRGGVSYAIDTVRAVAAEHPGAELFFIVGEDSVAGLPHWKAAEELKRLCRFVVYPRTRESSTEIRRRLAAGEAVGDLVPPAVAALMRSR
jgi:nicotinate-nucleotide adenylyltransferase